MILITFYEFGDVKDLSDVKYHMIEDTVVVVTLSVLRNRVTIIGTTPS